MGMLSGACDGPDGKSAFLRMLWIKVLCILYKVTNTPENTLLILGVMLIHVPLQTESHIADCVLSRNSKPWSQMHTAALLCQIEKVYVGLDSDSS